MKKIFDPHVSCRPGKMMANQHISKSGLSFKLLNPQHIDKILKNT